MRVPEDDSMLNEQRGFITRLVVVCLLLGATAVVAQDAPAPRSEVYGGYTWYNPGARLNGGVMPSLKKGFTIQGAYFFNRYVGFKAGGTGSFSDAANVATIMAGPTLRAPSESITPFANFLVGLHRNIPPKNTGLPATANNGVGIAVGGGLDLNLTKLLAIRLIDAEYVYAHHNYSPAAGSRDWEGARVGGGLVLKFGSIEPPVAPTAACSAQPTEVFAGEPITVTANASNFPKNRTLRYSWTSTGGKTSGNAASTQVDTAGLNPGSYTVTSNIATGKKNETATCTANFTVKQPNPPTISCSANPTT